MVGLLVDRPRHPRGQQAQGWGAEVVDPLGAELRRAFPEMKRLAREKPRVQASICGGVARGGACAAGCCTSPLVPRRMALDLVNDVGAGGMARQGVCETGRFTRFRGRYLRLIRWTRTLSVRVGTRSRRPRRNGLATFSSLRGPPRRLLSAGRCSGSAAGSGRTSSPAARPPARDGPTATPAALRPRPCGARRRRSGAAPRRWGRGCRRA